MRILAALFLVLSLASCSSDTKSIPHASGMPGDMYLVMDSAQWRGPVGRTLDSIFGADVPGLPRKESIFKTRWIDPRKLNSLLKQRRNLLFVMTLDQHGQGARIVQGLFTPASLEKIKNEPNQYSRNTKDLFAKGQEVMFLYGKDEQTLLKNIAASSSRLIDYFNQAERERLTRTLFKAGQVKGVNEALMKDFKCGIKIPFGFKLADKRSDFIWLRQINPRDDRDIFISRKKYTSQKDFSKENLIRFRDDVCQKYLFEDPEKTDSYVLTETNIPFIPVTADTVNFNKRFAIQLRGLWRTNTKGMGGPFIGFALVDEQAQQFYYIEGFTSSPGKDQREIMRELETILYTFKTSGELEKK
jgi:hypothetical protein